MAEQQLCSEQESLEILGCTSSELQRYADEGRLQVFIDGENRKFRLQEIQDFLEELHRPNTIQEAVEGKSESEKASNDDILVSETFSESSHTAALQTQMPCRDRIVVLGRTRAGKTVFMTRLYEQLWESKDSFFIKALSGNVHRHFMHAAQELSEGRWVPPTGESTYADFELTDGDQLRLMVSLDYPGELFSLAFVDGASRPDVLELIDHVDRASAVILLLPPDRDDDNQFEERLVDTFGMHKVVEHIRQSPGGRQVPIAVVVTKGDQYKEELRKVGGLRKFLVKHYLPLLRVIGHYRPFIIAAVQCKKNKSDGSLLPSFDLPPVNLLDPLKWCWEKLDEEEARVEKNRRFEIYHDQERRSLEEHNKRMRRAVFFWSIFWSLVLIVGSVIVVLTWVWMQPE